tara:strand:- start:220 stop:510 length:291 start_codon:yes stop_codon:yes gene_type:complete
MLTIRMRRVGAKKKPIFRVVVIDSRAARDGRSLEVLGHYNPTTEPESLEIKRPRLDYWLAKGAKPSDTVRTLLSRQMNLAKAAVSEPADVVEVAES